MKTWPHAPSKLVTSPGTYIVTASTINKEHFFRDDARIATLHDTLLEVALEQGWELLAWAVFSNHYHVVGISPNSENAPGRLCGKIHGLTAIKVNQMDGTPNRRVWYRSWQTMITFEKSLLARIAYVHTNAVKHGLVKNAKDYPWCSAAWFEREGDPAFVEMVRSFKTDRVNVIDDF